MDTIDIILLIAVLVPGIWQGLKKGFIFQLVTLTVLIAGTFLSYHFCESVASWLGSMMKADPVVLKILSFTVIFAVVYILLYALGKLLLKVVKILLGGWVDKVLGILLATFKFALIVGLLVLGFDLLNAKIGLVQSSTLETSGIYGFLKEFAQTVCPFIKGLILK